MIYFMQSVDGGPIKIGCSVNVEKRQKELEYHYGTPLVVLATMPGDAKDEAEIHARFAHLRLSGSKPRGRKPEQFRPDRDLMEFIDRPLFVNQGEGVLVDAMLPSRAMLFSIKGRPSWYAWLKNLAIQDRSSVVELIDRATARYAKDIGYLEPPPER